MISLQSMAPEGQACVNCIGGIKRAALIDCGFIDFDAVTVDADGHITAIAVTLAGAGEFVEWVPDADETARFDATGERTGKRYRSNQESFMKFECITLDSQRAAELAKDACCLVVLYEYNNGAVAVQGIDIVVDGAGYKAVSSITTAKANPSALSDTSANAARVEVLINSVSLNVVTMMADPSTFGLDEALAL